MSSNPFLLHNKVFVYSFPSFVFNGLDKREVKSAAADGKHGVHWQLHMNSSCVPAGGMHHSPL